MPSAEECRLIAMPKRFPTISPCLIDNVDEKIMSEACAKECTIQEYPLSYSYHYHLGLAPMLWMCFDACGVSIIISTSAKKTFPLKLSRCEFPARIFPAGGVFPATSIIIFIDHRNRIDHEHRRRQCLLSYYDRSPPPTS